MKKQQAYLHYHHSPEDSLAASHHLAKQVYGTTGISTGSKNLDAALVGTRPSWIRMWIAASGHGKSTQLRVIALKEARRLMASTDPRDENKYVAMLTYEEDIGSQEIHLVPNPSFTKRQFWAGEVEPNRYLKAAADRVALPIHMFGQSMYKEAMNKHRGDAGPPTIYDFIEAVHGLHDDKGLLPSLVIVDYLQEVYVAGPGSNGETEQVIAAVRAIEQMAKVLNCPVELGAQAKQTTLDRRDPIPDQNDVEWAYKGTQKATMVVGLLRPWALPRFKNNRKYRDYGFPILKEDGTEVLVPFKPGLVLARPGKSRPDVLTNTIPYYVDMQTLAVMEAPGLWP